MHGAFSFSIFLHASQLPKLYYIETEFSPKTRFLILTLKKSPKGQKFLLKCALSFVTQAVSLRVFRTDVEGTCVFESDGTGWKYISL